MSPSNRDTDGGSTSIAEAIEPIELQEEMERSFLEYSMSVIISRALPDVRDGLKPVHRRILYSMYAEGHRPDRSYVKCAKVVGEVMGKFHPHGDSAIYDALARMVQDFSLRHPLISGHGNFGSPDPAMGPSAPRYTECKLAPISMELMAGLDEQTVDFEPNYDGTETQPTVLPARFPNLLVNGSQGIAVGMATQIPPHNLEEVIDATIYLLENPEATTSDLMMFVKGPDFPTGAYVLGRSGIRDIYETGRGSIKLRAVAEIVENKGSNAQIIVTEIPYQTSVEQISAKIGALVDAKVLDGIADVTDSTAQRGTRIVVDLKRDANPKVVLNNLYKHTPMQTSFSANMLALVDNVPRTLSLRSMLSHYIDHQVEVVTRRSQYRLRKARERAHIVEGLLRCIDILDQVIEAIRSSVDRGEARSKLMNEPFEFSEIQANHILDLTLGRLTRIGREELESEMRKLIETIAELEEILGSSEKLREVIKTELTEIRDKYKNPRRTQIISDPGNLEDEDLISDEPIVVMVTKSGYIKSLSDAAFKTQGRGGRGVVGAKMKEEDLVNHIIHTTTHSYLLVFSSRGRVYRIKGYEVPRFERSARGTAIVNLLPFDGEESVAAILDTMSFPEASELVFVTANGQVKKTPLMEYDRSRRDGLIAIDLREGDKLVKVFVATDNDDAILFSRNGQAIRFPLVEVRSTGRATSGVKGMKLREGDRVVSGEKADFSRETLVVTDKGYGKRIQTRLFPRQQRGGQGVRSIKVSPDRGYVVEALFVSEEDEVLVVSSSGVTIRTAAGQIASQGRDALGVKIIQLDKDQTVTSVGLVPVSSD
ncbi:DNA gyrase subunit A [Ferrithrix thermotolerans DSM 19514]|uniref:DNA topoisomerase (ATP-hydrolyzing) n=1 Tax=Ferrithrix thermotolerans DSM 19514 TaxID=1121881 RepID=A0A1M4XTR4_9ACTN|nr:DNA gyrase subunit A [Ferrithrix thermotolerans]SHE96967.1 DNA gyrase subunit A [Ferrithrix thermotolerans DSM 19514]